MRGGPSVARKRTSNRRVGNGCNVGRSGNAGYSRSNGYSGHSDEPLQASRTNPSLPLRAVAQLPKSGPILQPALGVAQVGKWENRNDKLWRRDLHLAVRSDTAHLRLKAAAALPNRQRCAISLRLPFKGASVSVRLIEKRCTGELDAATLPSLPSWH